MDNGEAKGTHILLFPVKKLYITQGVESETLYRPSFVKDDKDRSIDNLIPTNRT